MVLGLLWGAGAAGGRDNTPFSLVKVQFTSNFKYPSPTGEKQIKSSKGLHELSNELEIIETWKLDKGNWI